MDEYLDLETRLVEMRERAVSDNAQKHVGYLCDLTPWQDYHDSILLIRGIDRSLAHCRRKTVAALSQEGEKR